MRRYFPAVFLVLILAAFLIPVSACTSGASFQLEVLAISPQAVMEGDSVTVSANVTNDGGSLGIFEALLSLDGAEVDNKEISINAGDTETVLFTINADIAGTHEIALNELTGSFSVFAAPGYDNLVISPAEARIGEQVSVSVDIINSGQIPADYAVCLELDGAQEQSRKVSVAGGEMVCPSFAVTKNEAGTYAIVIGSLSGSLTVLSPAGFEFGNLVISPQEAVAGWPASIMCDVTNTGGAEGCCSVALEVNGDEVETQEVTVSGGATETVAFSLVEDAGGSYAIAVGNLTGALVVNEGVLPTLHIGDEWVYRVIADGMAYTRTEVVTGLEKIDDKECYVVRVTYDPPLEGVVDQQTEWWDKSSLTLTRLQFSATFPSGATLNRSVVYTVDELVGQEWPYEVGNEFTAEESWTITDMALGQRETQTGAQTSRHEVAEIEQIDVGAGTLRCFRTIIYEYSSPVGEYWYSDRAKAYLKYSSSDGDYSRELLSYSIKSGS